MSKKINIAELSEKFAHHGGLAPQEIRDLLDWLTEVDSWIQSAPQ